MSPAETTTGLVEAAMAIVGQPDAPDAASVRRA
jgi:hypothetical protein